MLEISCLVLLFFSEINLSYLVFIFGYVTSHMPRNMVIGKLKYLIGPASGTISHPPGRTRVYIFVATYGYRVVGLCSRGGCSGSTDWKERGKVVWAGAKLIPMRVV